MLIIRFLAAMVIALAALVSAQTTMPPGIIIEGKGYMALPGVPVVLPPGDVQRMFWDESGENLLITVQVADFTPKALLEKAQGINQPIPGREKCVAYLYSPRSRALRKAFDFVGSRVYIEYLKIWGSQEYITCSINTWQADVKQRALCVNLKTSERIEIFSNGRLEYGKTCFAFSEVTGPIRLYAPSGKLLRTIDASTIPTDQDGYTLAFLRDSDELAASVRENQEWVMRKLLPNGRLGALVSQEQFAFFHDDSREPTSWEFELGFSRGGFSQSSKQLTLIKVPLASKEAQPGDIGQGLIADDASVHWASNNNRRVAYLHRGIPIVVEIIEVDPIVIRKALASMQKEEAIEKVKAVGLAILMYATDNDDLLPVNDASFRSKVLPYMVDGEILKEFVYTYNGVLESSAVLDSGSTILGHIDGPGGRAVVYVDGHAQWIPD